MRNPPKGYEPLERDALIAQAKQHARRMRRQAVPDFWDGVDASCKKFVTVFDACDAASSVTLVDECESFKGKGGLTCPF
jgi:hypothetical protein